MESLVSLKTQGSRMVLARTNPSGGVEGHGSLGGMKSLERRHKAHRVLWESAGTKRGWETDFGSPKGRKALEGEAHERWGLKEASKVEVVRKNRCEEGSQTLNAGLSESRATLFERSFERRNEKKDDLYRKCCRAEDLMRGAFRGWSEVDRDQQ